jgi:hypothetical protein
MQHFKRPPKPADFSKKVKSFKDKLKSFFSSKASGTGKPDFADKWKEFKSYFAKAQHGKCGYCEIRVIGGQDGDVEHFYPKGEVWKLKDDPTKWGTEQKYSSAVKGRERDVICKQGYWWLAYDWSNYLLSCAVCNQKWKLSYFPVGDNPRNIPPSKKTTENVLLLNPYDTENPANHLRFDDLGQIEAKTDDAGKTDSHGYETIRTCGLDRESLRDSRKEKAVRAYNLIVKLDKVTSEQQVLEIFKDFHSLGDEETIHSGMVRIIFEDYSGMSWDKLERKINNR